jgi:hypothetical protein
LKLEYDHTFNLNFRHYNKASTFGMDKLVSAVAAELAKCPAMRRWARCDGWLGVDRMRLTILHFKSAFRHHDTTKAE